MGKSVTISSNKTEICIKLDLKQELYCYQQSGGIPATFFKFLLFHKTFRDE